MIFAAAAAVRDSAPSLKHQPGNQPPFDGGRQRAYGEFRFSARRGGGGGGQGTGNSSTYPPPRSRSAVSERRVNRSTATTKRTRGARYKTVSFSNHIGRATVKSGILWYHRTAALSVRASSVPPPRPGSSIAVRVRARQRLTSTP